MKPNLKPPKLDKDTLLDRRYDYMRQAFMLDGRTSVGFHYKALLKAARERYAENGNTKTADDLLKLNTFDVCHLNHRTNTGEFDGLEWLATASRLEHNFLDGKEPAPHKFTAEEYKYWWLYQLKGKPNDRWSKPRELLEKKISEEKLKEIRRIR